MQSSPVLPPRPAIPFKGNLPRLDNWDPRVWVGQEVHSYKITEHLATGLTGYVFRASFGQAGTEMAIKIPILRTGAGAAALEETMSEATRLLELSEQSKYVVQLRGILVDRLNIQEIVRGDTQLYLRSPPAIVMELMKGGAAKGLLEDASYDSLYYSEKWGGIVMLIGYMIASGLETIHNAGFVHLDVKPQNILFNIKPPATGQEMRDQMRSGTLVPKLADLGSAVRIGGKVGQFTSEYAPGEQVLGDSTASSMDIYALGATLYNMLTKTPVNSKKLIELMNTMTSNPGSGRTANELRSAWNSFNPDFDRISKLAPSVPVLKKMLDKDPRHRPSAGSAASLLRDVGDKTLS
jgi:serine/threonine protein kinase